MSEQRDVELSSVAEATSSSSGRSVVAVIGIDRYQGWRPLTNAVGDARGAAALFRRLGFEQVTEPLLDGRATGKAIQELVADDLRTLGPDDSLVLFYAGHGGTRTNRLGSQVVKTGYLIPVDASDKAATWIELDAWLGAVSLLPAKHVLVIIDACHSGIALGPIIKWRDTGTWQDTPLSTLRARRSRRIITSALDDQMALDSGPVHGHSLFTGCLIEGLTHGIGTGASRVTTGSELGQYVQRRVTTYPGSRQTPDFGTFAFDDRGEMVIQLATSGSSLGAELGGERPVTAIASTPELAAERASRERPRDRRRRWIVVGAAGGAVAIAVALVAYLTFGDGAPEGVSPVDAPRDVAAHGPLLPGDCPQGMVPVPVGTFQMGSPGGVGDADEQPQHAVTLSAYCIDKQEVTVEAYWACVTARGCSSAPRAVSFSWTGSSADELKLQSRFCNRAARPGHPMNCVDWNQAAAYCRWQDKRLPSEAEWEYAARGNNGWEYPWGNEAPSETRLNACGRECVTVANRDLNQNLVRMYNARDGWETTAPVGRFPGGASPFGALDMAGNVSEWVADWSGPFSASATRNPHGAATGMYRVYRGGSWKENNASFVRAAHRYWVQPMHRLSEVGFRCARGTESP